MCQCKKTLNNDIFTLHTVHTFCVVLYVHLFPGWIDMNT